MKLKYVKIFQKRLTTLLNLIKFNLIKSYSTQFNFPFDFYILLLFYISNKNVIKTKLIIEEM